MVGRGVKSRLFVVASCVILGNISAEFRGKRAVILRLAISERFHLLL